MIDFSLLESIIRLEFADIMLDPKLSDFIQEYSLQEAWSVKRKFD